MNRQFLFCQIGSHKNGKWFLKKWKNLQQWFPKKRKTLLYTIYIQNKTPLFAAKLGLPVEAKSRYYRLLDYGERHLYDKMRVEYFAVSLPDFMIFDDDLDKRNKTHCYYLMGLGYLGLGDKEKAVEAFRNAMQLDPTHLNAGRYLKMAEE